MYYFEDFGSSYIHFLNVVYAHLTANIFQIFITRCYKLQDKTEEIWLSPMTKAPSPTEMSNGQSDNTNNTTKKFD